MQQPRCEQGEQRPSPKKVANFLLSTLCEAQGVERASRRVGSCGYRAMGRSKRPDCRYGQEQAALDRHGSCHLPQRPPDGVLTAALIASAACLSSGARVPDPFPRSERKELDVSLLLS
jgi:hypothetical protein